MKDNTARIFATIAFHTITVTPVLVTGAHFSPKRHAHGTMDTGDKRRYDLCVFLGVCLSTSILAKLSSTAPKPRIPAIVLE